MIFKRHRTIRFTEKQEDRIQELSKIYERSPSQCIRSGMELLRITTEIYRIRMGELPDRPADIVDNILYEHSGCK